MRYLFSINMGMFGYGLRGIFARSYCNSPLAMMTESYLMRNNYRVTFDIDRMLE